MLNIIWGVGFAALGVILVLLALSPADVTRDDNPITARLVGLVIAVICFMAAAGFIFGG